MAFSGAIGLASSVMPANAVTIAQHGSDFSYNGHSYSVWLSDAILSWSDARAFAQGLGSNSDLASINDAGENAAIYAQITDHVLWTTDLVAGPWIGLFQPAGSAEPGDGWQWVNGTTIASYINWAQNEPDNYIGDNVGVFWANGNIGDTWGDTVDSSNPFFEAKSFVVETTPAGPSVPMAPGPLPLLGAGTAFGWSRRLRRRISPGMLSRLCA